MSLRRLIFSSLLTLSSTIWAAPFPLCERLARLDQYSYLAPEMDRNDIDQIIGFPGIVDRLEQLRKTSDNFACEMDSTNHGLANLFNFIQTQHRTLIERLLGAISGSRAARALEIYSNRLSSCQQQEQRDNLDALALARAAYTLPPPVGSQLFSHEESGLQGFVKTQGDLKTFAFTGSQFALNDWFSNIEARGGAQLLAAFNLKLAEALAWVSSGKKIRCTGHSLGGALAEGFCAMVMRLMRERDQDFGQNEEDNRIKTVTFNALGGSVAYKYAASRYQGRGVPWSEQAPVRDGSWLESNSTHYHVEGDKLLDMARGVTRYFPFLRELIFTPHISGTTLVGEYPGPLLDGRPDTLHSTMACERIVNFNPTRLRVEQCNLAWKNQQI